MRVYRVFDPSDILTNFDTHGVSQSDPLREKGLSQRTYNSRDSPCRSHRGFNLTYCIRQTVCLIRIHILVHLIECPDALNDLFYCLYPRAGYRLASI